MRCLKYYNRPRHRQRRSQKGDALEIGNLCYRGNEGQILLQALPVRPFRHSGLDPESRKVR